MSKLENAQAFLASDAAAPQGEAYARWWPESRYLKQQLVPREERLSLNADQIHLDRFQTAGAPLTIILLHGAGGHGRLLLPYALPLAAAGYDVVAPDLPNFGRSVCRNGPITFDHWVSLASALVDREGRDGRKIVLYGLSIGGTTAYHVAAENPRVSGVIATTLADPRDPAFTDAAAANRFMARVALPIANRLPWLLDRLRLSANRLGRFSAMSPDTSLVRRLSNDRTIGRVKMPAAFFRTLSSRNPAREPEQFTSPPVLLAHPGADQWTPLALSKGFFDRIAAPKKLVVLSGAAHLPLEQPGFDELQEAALEFLARVATSAHAPTA